LRLYWSEIAEPEAWLSNPESARKATSQFQQVLRQILAATTPIPFPFPTLAGNAEAMQKELATEWERYRAALERIGNAVQYEVVASWAANEQKDLATPVSGREYAKRRQEAAERIAAVDRKLKSVTAGSVREWRARQERKSHRWFALVSRDDRQRFVAALRSAGASEGVRLRLSGPWPPSAFIELARERG